MKIIYIAGDGRSGSTILDAILGNASNSISVGECCRFWTRFNEKKTLCGCSEKIENCELWSKVDASILEKFQKYDSVEFEKKVRYILYFKNFKKIPTIVKDPEWNEFCEIVKHFYNSISEIEQKEVIIDSTKYPNWAYFLKSLNFCEINIIHLERNLQSVANSWKKKMLLPEYYDLEVFMPVKHNYVILKSWLKVKYLCSKLKNSGSYLYVNYELFCENPKKYFVEIENLTKIDFPMDNLVIPNSHSIGGNPIRANTGKNTITIINKKDTLSNLNGFEKNIFKFINKVAKVFIK